jgi:hypothetical protein
MLEGRRDVLLAKLENAPADARLCNRPILHAAFCALRSATPMSREARRRLMEAQPACTPRGASGGCSVPRARRREACLPRPPLPERLRDALQSAGAVTAGVDRRCRA